MTSAETSGWWLIVRRPLLLAFVLGCALSLVASGRVSVRLILDGAISFAFVPVIEAAAFAIVHRFGARRMRLARAMDLFFATNGPWLLLAVVLAALVALQPPRAIPPWTVPPKIRVVAAVLALTIAWSAYRDFIFFRDTLRRSAAAAVRDLVLLRAIAWPCGIAYFFGYAIWPLIVSWKHP